MIIMLCLQMRFSLKTKPGINFKPIVIYASRKLKEGHVKCKHEETFVSHFMFVQTTKILFETHKFK
jgi:hypothetical protein